MVVPEPTPPSVNPWISSPDCPFKANPVYLMETYFKVPEFSVALADGKSESPHPYLPLGSLVEIPSICNSVFPLFITGAEYQFIDTLAYTADKHTRTGVIR